MGRAPCCDKANVKKGPWSPEEDRKLKEYIEKYGTGGNWIALPHKAGLKRCGKSCRLRWLNYLRPNIKHGDFSDDEDRIICNLFASIGSRWSIIAAQLPGRTDNDIKNYWNTKLKKKLMGLPPTQRSKPNPQHHPQPQHQQQQQLSFFPPPLPPPHNGATTVGTTHPFSLHHLPSHYSYTTTSLLNTTTSSGSSLLMFGGDHHGSSCSSSDNVNLYFELCNSGNSNASASTIANANAGLECFLFGGLDDTQKLLLPHQSSTTLDHYSDAAAAYEQDMKPLVVPSTGGVGSTNLFYSGEPSSSGASQGRFLY